MTIAEQAFLAQMALGWFEVKPDGTIWRSAEYTGGGTPSLKRIIPTRAERSCSTKGGYLRVMFRSGGKRLQVAAHRIVWMVTNRLDIPTGMEINHQSGNKSQNDPENLELVTRSENVIHSFRNLPRKKKAQRGSLNAKAKLTQVQVDEIRALWKVRAMSQREMGLRFGVTQSAISTIVLNKAW